MTAPAAAMQHRPTSFDTIDVVQYCKAKALKDVRGSSAPTDFLHCVNSVLRKMEAKTLGFLDSLLAKTGGCKEVGKGLNKRYYYETILILICIPAGFLLLFAIYGFERGITRSLVFYRKAFLGWILVTACTMAWFVLSQWVDKESRIGMVLCFVVVSICLGLAYRIAFSREEVERRARQAWLLDPGRCPKCKYDLRGTDGSLCPECGWEIPATDR